LKNESHNGKLLKPAAYQLMTNYSITSSHKLFGISPIGYGYGLRINDKADIYEIGHTGFHPGEGFTAVNLFYPKTKTSVIVMENQANENFEIAYHFEQEIRKIVKESILLK
jgi:D-alanyl-D-alanine carboxypeptidase